IMLLSSLGMSLNIMTLGGLALAIGILVDDATVEIENIHRNIHLGKDLQTAILDGAEQIAVPTFVATTAICIVFIPVVLLEGPARFLFVPFALAVVFAVGASYGLSRTLVPVMVKYMLRSEMAETERNDGMFSAFRKIHTSFNLCFDNLQIAYLKALRWSLDSSWTVVGLAALVFISGLVLLPFVGRDFFPRVDAGQFRLHVKARSGMRIEETEKIFTAVEDEIRNVIPKREIELLIDNIGVPAEAFNLAFGDSATIGTADGEVLVSLSHHRLHSTPYYMQKVRTRLSEKFPDVTFYYQPADIVNQILSFGLPSPIDVRVAGYNRDENLKIANEIMAKIKMVRGAADVHLHQEVDSPVLRLNVDRTRAARFGLTQRDVANDVLVSLSSNTQVTPNYWVDPATGIQYFLAVQTPQHKITSVDSILKTPLSTDRAIHTAEFLGNVADIERGTGFGVLNHFNVQPVFDIYANVQSRDLGGVSEDVQKIVSEYRPRLKPGNQIIVRGVVESMDTAFFKLGMGLAGAIVFVYLL
ncbi:MAG TPA: efflux RND transporter permease subunit, partial [Chroococcales cyanobacterium]